ncbi:MAG: sulfatase-like hydrolase/transferase [Caldilineaceae bacterium]
MSMMPSPDGRTTNGNATSEQHLSRRNFLGMAGMTLAGTALAVSQTGRTFHTATAQGGTIPAPNIRPNIILIITDQERYPRHWPENWVLDNLPAHKRLMEHGLTFRRFFCNAAMCSPSRATLFTGMHPQQHGVTRTLTVGGTESPTETPLAPGVQTLGKMLADVGYHVAFKGKYHISKAANGGEPTATDAAALGFKEWEPTTMANDAAVENFAGGCADWDRVTADQAVTFLATQSAESTAAEPFALVVGLGNPHDVLAFPRLFDAEDENGCTNYADFDFERGIDLPPTINEDLSTKPTCQTDSLNLYNVGLGVLTTPLQKRAYANFYAALIQEADKQVTRVLDAIPAAIRDHTIVIYTSDHGEMGMSHGGQRQKMFNVYEETVNVPLIIYNPLLFPQAQTTDAYGSLLDLMPTIASLARVPNRERWLFYGTDLTPLVDNPAQPVQSEILFTFDDKEVGQTNGIPTNPQGKKLVQHPYFIRAIFTQDSDGEWKYARYFDPSGVAAEQYEMYHLRDGNGQAVDPNEESNLAHEAKIMASDLADVYRDKRAELAERLATLEAERLQPLSHIYLPTIQQS